MLNQSPEYEMTIPSTGLPCKYRPYLVKEEKVLLIAYESQDKKMILNAMASTIEACCDGVTSAADKLTVFDIEYMFGQIRAKSVGESSLIGVKCSECNHSNEVTVDIAGITVEMPKASPDIEIQPGIVVTMKYPVLADVADIVIRDNLTNSDAFDMMAACIDKIKTEDEIHNTADEDPAEVIRFVESLRADQVQKMIAYIDLMPRLETDIEFECKKCKHTNSIHLEGLTDFFS